MCILPRSDQGRHDGHCRRAGNIGNQSDIAPHSRDHCSFHTLPAKPSKGGLLHRPARSRYGACAIGACCAGSAVLLQHQSLVSANFSRTRCLRCVCGVRSPNKEGGAQKALTLGLCYGAIPYKQPLPSARPCLLCACPLGRASSALQVHFQVEYKYTLMQLCTSRASLGKQDESFSA